MKTKEMVFYLLLAVSITLIPPPPASAHDHSGGNSGGSTRSGDSGGPGDGPSTAIRFQNNNTYGIKGLTPEKVQKEKDPAQIDKNIRGAISFMLDNPVVKDKETEKAQSEDKLAGDLRALLELHILCHKGSDALDRFRETASSNDNINMFNAVLFHFILNGND